MMDVRFVKISEIFTIMELSLKAHMPGGYINQKYGCRIYNVL
jgi:hypothetical protein